MNLFFIMENKTGDLMIILSISLPKKSTQINIIIHTRIIEELKSYLLDVITQSTSLELVFGL